MFRDSFLLRSLLVYGLCLPLALFLGYLIASPNGLLGYAIIGLIMMVLVTPILLRWHHLLLILAWNSYLIVFFLPGQPSLGVVAAAVSLCLVLLTRTMHRRDAALHVPSVARPLILIAIVVVVTARLTGGIGGQAIGAEAWGGKKYLGVFGAIMGYFALVAERISRNHTRFYAYAFVLSSTTALVSDIAYALGPKFYFLFSFFSVGTAVTQAVSQETLLRLSGVSFAAMSGYSFMLMYYGIRGICNLTKPWRLIVFLSLAAASLFGGYRSALILILLISLIQFYLEGLFRSRLLIFFALGAILVATGMVAFSDKLPLSVQRSLSFLPLQVHPSAKFDAQTTLDWRLEMWRLVVKEIPTYLFLGKGFAYSGTDYYLTQEAVRRGLYHAYEDTLISGTYHQGILTLLVPFGILGLVGFLWFCWESLKVLLANYRYGENSLRTVNCFLLAHFVARLVFYLIFYGQFDQDLMIFTGIIGLSVSLNGGMKLQRQDESAIPVATSHETA